MIVTIHNVTAQTGNGIHPADPPQYFGLLFDEINDGVFLYDFANARVRAANRRAQEMFGYSADEVLGLTIADVTAGTPPHAEADALAKMQEIVAADRTEVFEWRARNKSGRLFWVEVIARRVRIEDEDLLLVMLHDIGEADRGAGPSGRATAKRVSAAVPVFATRPRPGASPISSSPKSIWPFPDWSAIQRRNSRARPS